jgi:hypothetical protein
MQYQILREVSIMARTKANKDQPKESKLTLAKINQYDSQLDEVKRIPLPRNDFITIQTKFRKTKIEKFILDLYEALLVLRIEKVKISDVRNAIVVYQMLLIKHFSDLGLGVLDMEKKEDVSKLLKIADKLIDLGVYDTIINSFPQEEINKIDEAIKASKIMKDQMGEMFLQAVMNEHEKIASLVNEENGVDEDASVQQPE